MPVRAPRVCGHCGKTHLTGEQCLLVAARDKGRKAAFDKTRPSARQRGYSKEWEKARADYLAVYPTCARCSAPATVVDHIKAHKGSDALFWDRRNWQALCAHHHNSAKQSEERRKPKG